MVNGAKMTDLLWTFKTNRLTFWLDFQRKSLGFDENIFLGDARLMVCGRNEITNSNIVFVGFRRNIHLLILENSIFSKRFTIINVFV